MSTSDCHTGWRPVSAASDHFIRWLFCVAEWYSTVPTTGSTSATHPRVSIGWFEYRCCTNVSRTTRSAPANAASTSP